MNDLRHGSAAGQIPQPRAQVALAAATDLVAAPFSPREQRLRPCTVGAPWKV